MSFGTCKSGANTTDKKLIKRYVAAGWAIDKIASKLSLRPKLVANIVDFNAHAKKGAPVSEAEAEAAKAEIAKEEAEKAAAAKATKADTAKGK